MTQKPLDNKIPAHERVLFYKERAQAYQNLLELMLPEMIMQTITLLQARAAINQAESRLGVKPDEQEAARKEELRIWVERAYPALKGKTLGEMAEAIRGTHKRTHSDTDGSTDQSGQETPT